MTTLAVMQRYADHVADKLGLGEGSRPVLRWYGAPCKRPGWTLLAHCHYGAPEGLPRGTICIVRGRTEGDGSWRRLIAHEVTHLAVKNHKAIGFLKRLHTVGQADPRERRQLARAGALRHRHDWRVVCPTIGAADTLQRYCNICRKWETGTIAWKGAKP